MGWQHPISGAPVTRGFGPSAFDVDAPFYSDGERAHPAEAGVFPGAFYVDDFHAAIDYAASTGTPILAPMAGTVLDAQWGIPGSWADGGGLFVRVQVNPACMYLMAHCSALYVRPGEFVRQGQRIADVGSTGYSTGPHCHFWIRHGPAAYYAANAFYYDPRLILPGGRLHGDRRFEYPSLPDTAADELDDMWDRFVHVHREYDIRAARPGEPATVLRKGPGHHFDPHFTVTEPMRRTTIGYVEHPTYGLWLAIPQTDGTGVVFGPNSRMKAVA